MAVIANSSWEKHASGKCVLEQQKQSGNLVLRNLFDIHALNFRYNVELCNSGNISKIYNPSVVFCLIMPSVIGSVS